MTALIVKDQTSESGLDTKMAIEGKGRQASFFVVHSPKNLDFGTVGTVGTHFDSFIHC